ncbi:unnamed protein product, partial [Prunus brigantina]
ANFHLLSSHEVLPAGILIDLHQVRRLKMDNLLIDSSFALRMPNNNASYSALLFEPEKSSVMACSNNVPSGVIITMPAPAPLGFEAVIAT